MGVAAAGAAAVAGQRSDCPRGRRRPQRRPLETPRAATRLARMSSQLFILHYCEATAQDRRLDQPAAVALTEGSSVAMSPRITSCFHVFLGCRPRAPVADKARPRVASAAGSTSPRRGDATASVICGRGQATPRGQGRRRVPETAQASALRESPATRRRTTSAPSPATRPTTPTRHPARGNLHLASQLFSRCMLALELLPSAPGRLRACMFKFEPRVQRRITVSGRTHILR